MKTAVNGPISSKSGNVGWVNPRDWANMYNEIPLKSTDPITDMMMVLADFRMPVLSLENIVRISHSFLISFPRIGIFASFSSRLLKQLVHTRTVNPIPPASSMVMPISMALVIVGSTGILLMK